MNVTDTQRVEQPGRTSPGLPRVSAPTHNDRSADAEPKGATVNEHTDNERRAFSVVTPDGVVVIHAVSLRNAKTWMTRNVPELRRRNRKTGERLFTAEWKRIRVRGRSGLELRVINNATGEAVDGSARIVPGTLTDLLMPRSYMRSTVRTDRCTCEPVKFSGACPACQMAGVTPTTNARTNALRNAAGVPVAARDDDGREITAVHRAPAWSASESTHMKMGNGHRAVVIGAQPDASGRTQMTTCECVHVHRTKDAALRCARRTARRLNVLAVSIFDAPPVDLVATTVAPTPRPFPKEAFAARRASATT